MSKNFVVFVIPILWVVLFIITSGGIFSVGFSITIGIVLFAILLYTLPFNERTKKNETDIWTVFVVGCVVAILLVGLYGFSAVLTVGGYYE